MKEPFLGARQTLSVRFSGGGSWSPVDVFEFLRQEQLSSGAFNEVVWTSSD